MTEGSSRFRPLKRIFCNKCKDETTHNLTGEHSRPFYEDHPIAGPLYVETQVHLFWICAGCGTGTLEKTTTFDNVIEESTGYQLYDSGYYYPKRSQYDANAKSFKRLPEKLDRIYRETINAFNTGLYILCAAGLRSIIEGICDDKEISVGERNKEKRFNAMVEILPENIVKNLHGFRFMGNEALHDLTIPKKEDLLLAIEISEDLLNFLYELDYKARRLKISIDKKPSGEKVIPMKDRKNRDK